MQICTWEDSSTAQECDINASVWGEARGIWGCLSYPLNRAAAVVASVGPHCSQLGAWHLPQALPAARTDKIAASPLCQMALALWLGIPCLSYQCFAGLHICEGWMFEMLLQKGGLTHSCRVCALSAPYSTYIADRMGHCIYIDRKVLILLRETMQVNCKNCFRKQSSSRNFT